MSESDKQDKIISLLTQISERIAENTNGQAEILEAVGNLYQLLDDRFNSADQDD